MKSLIFTFLTLFCLLPQANVKSATIADADEGFYYSNAYDHIEVEPFYYNIVSYIYVRASFKDQSSSIGTKTFEYRANYISKNVNAAFYNTNVSGLTYSDKVPFKAKYNVDEVELTLTARVNGSPVFSKTISIKRKERDRVYYTKMKDASYTPSGQIYYYDLKEGEKYISEQYVFNGFGGYALGSYCSIDFSDLSFYYYADDQPFTYQNCSVVFPNISNELDNCGEKYGSSYREFKLSITFDEETRLASFKLNESLYVNPITRKMSSKEEEGYAKTELLYISWNTIEQLQIRRFFYLIDTCGKNNMTYYLHIGVVKVRTLFGFSTVADYKMCSDPATADFDSGRVYDHHD